MNSEVLIAEDDDLSRELLEQILTEAGFRVTVAVDGQDALEKLRNSNCRLVISDWDMPRMNGIELCKALRRGEFAGYVYAILLTSHDTVSETIAGLSAGADDFIKKPFEPAELIVRVQAGLRVLSLEAREVTIFALAKLAESRDPETGAHLERVRNYCRVLAQRLAGDERFAEQIDGEFIRLLYATSPLHDIGKVGIPDNVLLKPGKLTSEEFQVMKTHTTLGAETLAAALEQYPQAKFLRMASDIAASHHEKWDGSGYPRGLSGTQIPLCGRIVAVADVYDALSSKRVYKEAFTHEKAREIILEGRGKHFDPDIVAAFLAAENDFIRIRQLYDEQVAKPVELAAAGSDAKPAGPVLAT